MRWWMPAVAVMLLAGCGTQDGGTGTAQHQGLRANPCDYLSGSDFKQALGLALTLGVHQTGPMCAYTDRAGDTCDVTVLADSSRYASYKSAAANFGSVEVFPAGDQGFYSARQQSSAWLFDFGFTKGAVFAGMTCGAVLAFSSPKPHALALAQVLASRI
jgi:hypothetical protein